MTGDGAGVLCLWTPSTGQLVATHVRRRCANPQTVDGTITQVAADPAGGVVVTVEEKSEVLHFSSGLAPEPEKTLALPDVPLFVGYLAGVLFATLRGGGIHSADATPTPHPLTAITPGETGT